MEIPLVEIPLVEIPLVEEEKVMAGPDVTSNPSGSAANLPQRPNVSKARWRSRSMR